MNSELGSILNAAILGGTVAHLTEQTYTITSPIVIHVTSTTQGPLGIDGGGATLVSQVTNGQPLIQIIVDPGVDLRYLTLSNFTIAGNGREGDGISVVCHSNDSWVYNWTISDVTVQNVGGYGLNMHGSVFEGILSDSWMIDNAMGGANFSHSAQGGQVSALRWFGGGFEDNGGAGLMLSNGARDISVDGASFANNNGFGISAEWGITSVTSSDFVDNRGAGVWFQNFGSFNDNSFSTSGTQAVGVTGYLAGNATLIGNESTYTGTGSDPTILANLQGNGGLFLAGSNETVVTGTNVVVSGDGGGNGVNVSVNGQGVLLPTLDPVSGATAAPLANSVGTGALESALKAAISSGTVAHLTDQSSYTVTAPIVINITSSSQAAMGIDLGGAKIMSQIAGGGPVIEIIVAAGVDVGNLTLANFSIYGNGAEGDGIRIVADGANRSIQLAISNVNIEHVGGIGLDVVGNVRGTVFDSWMHGNVEGGARFAGSIGGGLASDLDWIGGGFRKNGVAGLILDQGAQDMTVKGAYFCENNGPGIDATSGIALVQCSGFENNLLTGAIVQGSANFVDNTFSTYGRQTVGIGGYLAGGTITLIGDSDEYYGPGADTTVLANVQGNGTLAIAGNGNVIVGPSVTVTGASPVVMPPSDPPTPNLAPAPIPAPSPSAKVMAILGLADDTGASSSDEVTSVAGLTGTADADALVRFAMDGQAITATATADATGRWSFTPSGLADGQHTIAASQAGATGTAAFSFTLDTKAPIPVFTGAAFSNGKVTLTGATGTANDTISIYDGYTWVGFATTRTDGKWTFTTAADTNVVYSYGAIATDLAGNEGRATTNYSPTGSPGIAPVVPVDPIADTTAPIPVFTGAAFSNEKVTLTGTTGTANDTISIYDGYTWVGFATTGSDGKWTLTTAADTNVVHSYGAIATDLAGNEGRTTTNYSPTGSPGIAPMVPVDPIADTTAPIPVFTGAVLSNGRVTLTGATGTANDKISIYDGYTWLGSGTTSSDGKWTFTTAADPNVAHSYGANATDLAGNEGHGVGKAILGSTTADTLSGTTQGGSDRITGGGGADIVNAGSGATRFVYTAASDSTSAASDIIAQFQHGEDKIDFTNIAGIRASNGVPAFQGNISGSGNLTLAAHSVAYVESGGNTLVLVNTSHTAQSVTTTDTHAADMQIVLLGVNLGLTSSDLMHA